jgi:hypothetical protein
MSDRELIALEREVESARARVAADLVRLRSPATLAEFKDEFRAEARQSKDQLVEKSSDVVRDTAERLFTDLKGRAAANPAAALAIGAGLAWQLLRRPPIASLLVGAGVFGLMKTSPSADADFAAGVASQARDVASSVKERMQEWGTAASEAARETVSEVTDHVLSVKDQASSQIAEMGDAARQSVGQMAEAAAAAGHRASIAVSIRMPEKETRDQVLLGAAALAIAAALGIASQRGNEQDA